MSVKQGDLVWEATETARRSVAMTRFRHVLEDQWHISLPTYSSLHAFSVDEPEKFWTSLWKFARIVGDWDGGVVLERGATLHQDRWFPDARLNFAENLLCARAASREVLVARNERGDRRVITYAELQVLVARFQSALAEFGVREGSRVVGYLPNVPEAVVAMLATNALGAIWAVVSPDLSASAAADRIGQLEPLVLVTTEETQYGGKTHRLLDAAAQIAESMPTLVATVVVDVEGSRLPLDSLPHAVRWSSLLAGRTETTPTYRRLPFSAPATVLFTSGTTGKPKCLVHSAGGQLLQFAKEQMLHADIRAGDRLVRHTTTGWMMWNWNVGALARDATVVLYDGSPLYPTADALLDIADSEHATFFAPPAALLDAYVRADVSPRKTRTFDSLRTMYSGGMPVPASHYGWVQEHIKPGLYFSSPSGGTDPMAAFFAGDPAGKVRAGEIPVQALGMRMQIVDDAGHEVVGGPGELVCASSFPSMPVSLWGDFDGSRLHEAYFSRFPGKWAHGDWVECTGTGGYVIHGRSDATIKVKGLRIGTAEIYRPLESISEIDECAAVERYSADGASIVLLVRLAAGFELHEELRDRIRKRLRDDASPHHVPSDILAVPELPRNAVGKIMEVAIRDAVNGRSPRNLDAIANPDSVIQIQSILAAGHHPRRDLSTGPSPNGDEVSKSGTHQTAEGRS